MKKIIFLLSISFASLVSANDEVSRLKKCYSIFVREALPQNHDALARVRSGKISGTDACMEIFDTAQLGSNDQISKNNDGSYNATGMKVLKTFNNLHRGFFGLSDFMVQLEFGDWGTQEVTDPNEPAYHFTYVAFKKDEQYSKIITRNSGLRGVRNSSKSVRTRRVYDFQPFDFQAGHPDTVDSSLLIPWMPQQLVETGLLVGITADNRQNPAPTLVHNLASYTGYNMNEHFGAGVIGTQAFLLSATQINFNEHLKFSDGGLVTNRKWSKRVFSDLLCRDIPVLRNVDVVREVNINSSLSFRQGISCMGCHSSMDPMAGTIRNVMTLSTGRTDFGVARNVRFFAARTPDLGHMDIPSQSGNPDFSRSPATGRLKYRTYDGKLISEDVADLSELGDAIAAQDDLYACAAKRYFYFLTGVNVPLFDIGDINSPQMSAGEMAARDIIIRYGQELKAHQSVRTLIRTIVSSPTFINAADGI